MSTMMLVRTAPPVSELATTAALLCPTTTTPPLARAASSSSSSSSSSCSSSPVMVTWPHKRRHEADTSDDVDVLALHSPPTPARLTAATGGSGGSLAGMAAAAQNSVLWTSHMTRLKARHASHQTTLEPKIAHTNRQARTTPAREGDRGRCDAEEDEGHDDDDDGDDVQCDNNNAKDGEDDGDSDEPYRPNEGNRCGGAERNAGHALSARTLDSVQQTSGVHALHQQHHQQHQQQRQRQKRRVNHRLTNAVVARARLVEHELLPAVHLHYVIDKRLNRTDIQWKLRSTAIGLVVQLPHGLGEAQRRDLLAEVKSRVLNQSKEKKQRLCLSVMKKANMVEMRAKFGSMRYASVQAFDKDSYLVLGNLPSYCAVANKLAELKTRIVPLLVCFNIELIELKEIVIQSLRGRIFTNKDSLSQGNRLTARIDLRVRQFTNLEKLRSDRGLMITLIHELAHAITPTDTKQIKGRKKVRVSHGPAFWDNVMKIARKAASIEAPHSDEKDGPAQTGTPGKKIFELKDEREFRCKIEREDSLQDELDDDEEEGDHKVNSSANA